MKKRIVKAFAVAGLLLLAACGPKVNIGPNEIETSGKTPTPIVVPTCTPVATPSPVPVLHPTATPTPSPTPTNVPEPTAGPTVTQGAEPTATATPVPTLTVSPTAEPTVTPEPTAEPTATPTPEPTPMPTATPTPSSIPTPTPNPEPLVNNGWQKTVSVDDNYRIIFPEVFRDSAVEKTDRVLTVSYLCPENTEITFEISYHLQRTREEFVNEILSAGGTITEEHPEENRTICYWQTENLIHRAVFIDEQYPQFLVGTSFGEEEWTLGVMLVMFTYPADKTELYESEQYYFYVIDNGEE